MDYAENSWDLCGKCASCRWAVKDDGYMVCEFYNKDLTKTECLCDDGEGC